MSIFFFNQADTFVVVCESVMLQKVKQSTNLTPTRRLWSGQSGGWSSFSLPVSPALSQGKLRPSSDFTRLGARSAPSGPSPWDPRSGPPFPECFWVTHQRRPSHLGCTAHLADFLISVRNCSIIILLSSLLGSFAFSLRWF